MSADRRALVEGTVERRQFASVLDFRDVENEGGLAPIGAFSGYAATVEQPYRVGGENGFMETLASGCFRRCLGEGPDTVLTVNHGQGGQLPLARTKSGTLTLSEDERGLRCEAQLDMDDPDVQSLVPKLRRGDVNAMSLAFRATAQDWSKDRSERLIRELTVHRGDVSIVSSPANENTSLSLRGGRLTVARAALPPSYVGIAREKCRMARGLHRTPH